MLTQIQPDGRVRCCVPFCRRTKTPQDRYAEWVCPTHWAVVDPRLRRLFRPAKRRRTRRHGETRAGAGQSKISTPSPAMPLSARPGSGRAASVRQSSAPLGSEKQKAPATEPRGPNDRQVWACDIPRRTLAGPIWRRAEVESSRESPTPSPGIRYQGTSRTGSELKIELVRWK